ncbi:serine hydrolase [Arthrobacter tecti]
MTRLAELPLMEQPGTVWRYDLAYGVLGVLFARASGQPLDELLYQRRSTFWKCTNYVRRTA